MFSSMILLKTKKTKSLVCYDSIKIPFPEESSQGSFTRWEFFESSDGFDFYLNNHSKTLTNTENHENYPSMVNMNLYVLLKKKVT